MDYKQQVVNQIIAGSIGFLNNDQQTRLMDVMNIALYGYDLIPKDNTKNLPVAVDDFNKHVLENYLLSKAIAALSPETLNVYKYRLSQFMYETNKRIVDITTDDIKYYLAIRKSRDGISNTTLDHTRVILSSFFSWLHNEQYISRNPMKSIPKIKRDTKKEEPFTQSEIELLAIAINNTRDRAIMEFLLSTGCRVSELCRVNRSQIDFYTKQIMVLGKGGKERIVYLSDKSLIYLKKYLDERTDNNEALFVLRREPYTRVTKANIESMFRALGNKAGVTHVHPHRFRRTLCNTLIDRGMSLQDAQEVMGHSTPETTLIYYNNNNTNIHNKFNNLI